MTPLDRSATELRGLVQAFIHRFEAINAAAVNGPHADLSGQEVRVVERLGDRGPAMMRELAGHLFLAANSVTNLVDNLERRGLVRRQRSDEDRRVVRVELTGSGHAVYTAASGVMFAVLRGMLEVLGAKERETFVALFRKIAGADQIGA